MSKEWAQMAPMGNQYTGPSNSFYASRSLSIEEINALRNNVLGLLNSINTHRHRIQSDDFRLLNGHLQYTMTIFNNMIARQSVSPQFPSVPANNSAEYAQAQMRSLAQGKALVYNPDGSLKVVDRGDIPRTQDGWEQQFTSGTMINPPCYVMPPQNLTSLQKIRTASEAERLGRL